MPDKPQNQPGLHINLLLAGRNCLVVGGGRVASRKIAQLLDADANVTVVSPEVCIELEALIEQGRVQHIARCFEDADISGALLVYAATNSRSLNKQILTCCRTANILCCCVDGNWSESDFTTPATTRHKNLTLSISSGGTNCRQSKMVKNSLARHLQMMESAHLVIIGTDHQHLNVQEREPYHLIGPRLKHTGFMIMQLWGIHEFMILNTCNRVELIAVTSEETAKNGILRHAMGFTHLNEEQYYLKTDRAAFEHLCLVTAGMLSQTPGENHITAQIKQTLEQAKANEWAGNMLQDWTSSALQISKAIKNQTAPQLQRCEIEELCFRYLETTGKITTESTLMILGAGTIGRGLVEQSHSKVKRIIWCYHVNRPNLPTEWETKVELCTFDGLPDRLNEANSVISAADAPGHLLDLRHAEKFRAQHSTTLVDLGMPRNIAPELDNHAANLSVVDLDGLKAWHRNELTDLPEILDQSRAIITQHQDLYDRIANSFESGNAPQ